MSRIEPNQDFLTYTNGEQYMIIETPMPWNAYHDNSLILGNKFDGHVFLKITCTRTPSYYYIGNATDKNAPIFLKHFKTQEEQTNMNIVHLEVNDIAGKILSRFKSQLVVENIPSIDIEIEPIVQRVLKYIALDFNILDYWIHMEKERIEHLLEFYTFENLQIIYPYIISQDSYKDDVEYAYKNTIQPIKVPDLNIFCWVKDVVINF